MRGLPALAALLSLVSGCVLFVDDPEDWVVVEGSGGAGGLVVAPGAVGCRGGGFECSCEPGSSGSAACSSASLGGALCCADVQYPQASTSCSCKKLSCKQTTEGCSCYLGIEEGPSSSCTPKLGHNCCRYSSSCECGYGLFCPEGNAVERCDVDAMQCDLQIEVLSCSASASTGPASFHGQRL